MAFVTPGFMFTTHPIKLHIVTANITLHLDFFQCGVLQGVNFVIFRICVFTMLEDF